MTSAPFLVPAPRAPGPLGRTLAPPAGRFKAVAGAPRRAAGAPEDEGILDRVGVIGRAGGRPRRIRRPRRARWPAGSRRVPRAWRAARRMPRPRRGRGRAAPGRRPAAAHAGMDREVVDVNLVEDPPERAVGDEAPRATGPRRGSSAPDRPARARSPRASTGGGSTPRRGRGCRRGRRRRSGART